MGSWLTTTAGEVLVDEADNIEVNFTSASGGSTYRKRRHIITRTYEDRCLTEAAAKQLAEDRRQSDVTLREEKILSSVAKRANEAGGFTVVTVTEVVKPTETETL